MGISLHPSGIFELLADPVRPQVAGHEVESGGEQLLSRAEDDRVDIWVVPDASEMLAELPPMLRVEAGLSTRQLRRKSVRKGGTDALTLGRLRTSLRQCSLTHWPWMCLPS